MLARRLLAVAALVLLATPVLAHDWNDKNIAWKSLDDGLAEAKKDKKPICLIVYTEWCPHCANYAKIFSDPKIVEKSKSFVMIHIDQDKEKERATAYAPDGGYIPRTMFLASDGTLDKESTGGWIALLQHYFFSAWIPGDKDKSKFTLTTTQDNGVTHYVVRVKSDDVERMVPTDRVGASSPGQLELPQAAVVKHCPQGALRFAQVLFQPLHPRRMAGSIAFLKFPWKISGANSVR